MEDKIIIELMKLKRIKNHKLYNYNSDLLKRNSNQDGASSKSIQFSQMIEDKKAQMLLNEKVMLKEEDNKKYSDIENDFQKYLENKHTMKYVSDVDLPFPFLNKISNRSNINGSKNFIKDLSENYDAFCPIAKPLNKDTIELNEKRAIQERIKWSNNNIPHLEEMIKNKSEKKLNLIKFLNINNQSEIKPLKTLDPDEFDPKYLKMKKIFKINNKFLKCVHSNKNENKSNSIINSPKFHSDKKDKGTFLITQIDQEIERKSKYGRFNIQKNKKNQSTNTSYNNESSPFKQLMNSTSQFNLPIDNVSKLNEVKYKTTFNTITSNSDNRMSYWQVEQEILNKPDNNHKPKELQIGSDDVENSNNKNVSFLKFENDKINNCREVKQLESRIAGKKLHKPDFEKFRVNYSVNERKEKEEQLFLKKFKDYFQVLDKKREINNRLNKKSLVLQSKCCLSTRESSRNKYDINKNILNIKPLYHL